MDSSISLPACLILFRGRASSLPAAPEPPFFSFERLLLLRVEEDLPFPLDGAVVGLDEDACACAVCAMMGVPAVARFFCAFVSMGRGAEGSREAARLERWRSALEDRCGMIYDGGGGSCVFVWFFRYLARSYFLPVHIA